MKHRIAQKTADVIVHYLTKGEYDIRKSEQRRIHITTTIGIKEQRPEWISNQDVRRIKQENERELLNEVYSLFSSIFNKKSNFYEKKRNNN